MNNDQELDHQDVKLTKTKTKAKTRSIKSKNWNNYTKKRNYNAYAKTKDITTTQILRVVELAAVDTPKELIATSTNLTTNQVNNLITKYKSVYKQLDKLDELRKIRVDLIESSMYVMLESLNNKDKLDASDIKQVAYAFQQLFNAMRLETNKSTSNNTSITISNPAKRLEDL